MDYELLEKAAMTKYEMSKKDPLQRCTKGT